MNNSVDLPDLILKLKLESSEVIAAFYPLPEGFMLYALARCDKCGAACSLSTPSWPVSNPDIDRLEAFMLKLGAIRTVEPDQIGWNENFGGAVCYTCDRELG